MVSSWDFHQVLIVLPHNLYWVFPLRKSLTFCLLLFFSLLLFVPGISTLPVIDRDEAHFAQASRQMLQTNNYFQIRFQDKTRFQKPPGINWLQAASVKLFSTPDDSQIWPYRIPSVLGALLSVLLTWYFARRFINPATAVIASGMLASSLLLVIEAHMAVIDATLLSSIVLMQGSLWIIYHAGLEKKRPPLSWALCFWLAMSYGFVLKGVSPLVGILTVVTLCIIEKRTDWLAGLRIYRGLILFLILNLIWLILVNHAEQSNYLMQMINKDLLPKLQGGHESHGMPPLFHLAILPLTFWPASLFLWPAGVYAFKNRHTPVVKFLLSWLLPTWIFFECMPTKLPQYVLPLFPALALLSALAITNQFKEGIPGKWVRFLQILWGILSIGIGIFLIFVSSILLSKVVVSSILILSIISIFTGISVFYAFKGNYQRGVILLFIMAALTYPLIFEQLLPSLKSAWVTTTISGVIDKTRLSSEKPLLVAGFDEPSLVFNLNTKLVRFTDASNAIALLTQTPDQLALFERKALQSWVNRPIQFAIIAKVRGFDYSKGRWVTLFLIGQKSPKENLNVPI